MQECPHTFNLTRLSPRKIKCILTSLLLNFTPIDSYKCQQQTHVCGQIDDVFLSRVANDLQDLGRSQRNASRQLLLLWSRKRNVRLNGI